MKKFFYLSILIYLFHICGYASNLMLLPKFANYAEKKYPVDPIKDGHIYESVSVENESNKLLNGWLFSKKGDYGIALIGGGNAMGLGHTYYYNKHLINNGFRVVIISFQGYGNNDGKASLSSLTSDIKSFYDYARKKYPTEPIIFIGDSISTIGGICCASKYNIFDGLVMEGLLDPKQIPYTKVIELWPLWPLLPLTFPFAMSVSLSVPKELDVNDCILHITDTPILFIHHKKDTVTPFKTAKKIYEKYKGKKKFIVTNNKDSKQFHLNIHLDNDAMEEQKYFIKYLLSKGEKNE